MRYPDEQVASVGNLVDRLRQHLEGYDGPVWFRGQSKSEWPLVPKLLRGGPNPAEIFLINKFKQNATLLLMQHWSAPQKLDRIC